MQHSDHNSLSDKRASHQTIKHKIAAVSFRFQPQYHNNVHWVQKNYKNCEKNCNRQWRNKKSFLHNSHAKLLFYLINGGLFIELMGCGLCLDYVNLTLLTEAGIFARSLVGRNPDRLHRAASTTHFFHSV